MDNKTSIRNFVTLMTGSAGLSRDAGSAVTLYATNVTASGDQQNENAGALEAIVANIGKLAGLRHQVQLAAEQAFPWRNSGVASIRKSFQLPTDRPMRG
jgi:hypothetical protein